MEAPPSMTNETNRGESSPTTRFPEARRHGRMLPNRACEECRRKKTRCDMRKPECSLCLRIGEDCVYPRKRRSAKTRSTSGARRCSEAAGSDRSLADMSHSLGESLFDVGTTPTNGLALLESQVDTGAEADFAGAAAFPGVSDTASFPFGFDFLDTIDNTVHWPDEAVVDHSSLMVAGHVNLEDQSVEPNTTSLANNPQDAGLETSPHLPPIQPEVSAYVLDVEPSVIGELVDFYFERIHCFLPILNKDSFIAEHEHIIRPCRPGRPSVSPEVALLFNSMFGLSARFCNAAAVSTNDRTTSVESYIKQAMAIYQQSQSEPFNVTRKFTYLRGLTLLAFAMLQIGPIQQSWTLCGDCVRVAYEMELHGMDLDIICGFVDPQTICSAEWSMREGKRRLWWMIWDLDTFTSVSSNRPPLMDASNVDVFLPITDEAWRRGDRTVSVPLTQDIYTTSEKLIASTNDSKWAWFLVCTAVLRQVVEAVRLPMPNQTQVERAEVAMADFSLALPNIFQLDKEDMLFEENNFAAYNWILCTVAVLQW